MTSALAGTGLALSGMNLIDPIISEKSNFGIAFYLTQWGFKGKYDELAKAAKMEGYDGIAVGTPKDEKRQFEFLEAIHKHNISCSGFVSSGNGNNFQLHVNIYQ